MISWSSVRSGTSNSRATPTTIPSIPASPLSLAMSRYCAIRNAVISIKLIVGSVSNFSPTFLASSQLAVLRLIAAMTSRITVVGVTTVCKPFSMSETKCNASREQGSSSRKAATKTELSTVSFISFVAREFLQRLPVHATRGSRRGEALVGKGRYPTFLFFGQLRFSEEPQAVAFVALRLP